MSKTVYRARAPLRIGLAGGGTDIAAYANTYSGAILNATISMYAYASIEPLNGEAVVIESVDKGERLELPATHELPLDGNLDLIKGVYNRIVRDYVGHPLPLKLTTYVDAPPGSGLGSSSTLVVAIIGAFAEWLKIPLGDYDIAHLAWEIERVDLGYAGGKQDQYAATFGGFNFMEFYDNDKVIVNPLRIKPEIITEFEFNIVLFYTSISRVSSKIIEVQEQNITSTVGDRLNAMHEMKAAAYDLKEAVLLGKTEKIGAILHQGWEFKKRTAKEITNPQIDLIYSVARKAGASGGKISGAGGGGFTFFFCPGNTRYAVIEALRQFNGEFRRYNFTEHGLTTWKTNG